ncbi:hypothetical protein 015DV002_95 [Bacillus phage 015DV002]|nr:hypothetical protein 015DV002_95 [Bacillus phage 015DV002]
MNDRYTTQDLRLRRFWVPYKEKDYRVSLYDLYEALGTFDQGAYVLKLEEMGDCIWNKRILVLDQTSFWEFFDIAYPQIERKIHDNRSSKPWDLSFINDLRRYQA